MSFWRKLFSVGGGAAVRQRGMQFSEPNYSDSAAVPVTVDYALQLSAVWACAKLIAECLGSLPINIYKVNQLTGEKTPYPDHPLALLFNGKPNRWQTRNELFETLGYQLVLMGNCYCVIRRGAQNRIIELTPLMSQQMEVALQDSGAIEYRYTDGSNINIYSDQSMWHVKLFGNGIIGLSPLAYARNSIGIGLAAEKQVSKIYKNGGKPSGVLTIDKILSEAQREKIKQNFAEMQEGNQDRLFVLEAGMEYTQISLSPQDIELLASRKFQIEDIARFFGVPSVLINDTSASTTWGSGIQQIVQGFYKLGLRPYLERFEASMKAWLLTPQERTTVDIEFDFSALLRPDWFERMKAYKEAVSGALLTPDEARAYEGLAPKAGGQSLYMQQQMVPIEQLKDIKRGVSDAAQSQQQQQQA